jgi:hypothetical protein
MVFIKNSDNRIVNLSASNVKAITRGQKGEILIQEVGNSDRARIMYSYDELVEQLISKGELIELTVVSSQNEDEPIHDEQDDPANWTAQEDSNNQETDNLSSGADNPATKERRMKTEFETQMDKQTRRDRRVVESREASAERVFQLIRAKYNAPSISEPMRLDSFNGFDSEDFATTLLEGVDNVPEADDLITGETTVGGAIDLLERLKIQEETAKLSESEDASDDELDEIHDAETDSKKAENQEEDDNDLSEADEDDSEEEIEEDDASDDSDSSLPVTVDRVVAVIEEELDIASDDNSDINDQKTVGQYLEGTAGTIEDITDRVCDEFDVDIDDGEIFETTTIAQLTDLINSKKIAAE